ncbi:MAG TPA: type II toxin-antitoxin system prevent-host-death family antitoxin [Rubrivivax sp.]|nr:type II toxin-antitoxin system prevent-host-death family antitoxin [Rubrivivax sp.]
MTMKKTMQGTSVPAGEFKAHCLRLLDTVAASGEALTITKRGRPVARLVPLPAPAALFGALAGSVRETKDLAAATGEAWDADA